MPAEPITKRELNRATLARQMLLGRENLTVADAVERLVGLQAQEAKPPFIALWSRLEGFTRGGLTRQLHDRVIVRATAMRCTIHLMSAKDYLRFRGTLQPALTYAMQSVLRDRVDEREVALTVAGAADFFAAAPATFDDLRAYFLAGDAACDARALAYLVRTHLPLALMPTDAAWGYPGSAKFTPAAEWMGATPDVSDHIDEMMLRYLAAFGPASAADAQAWSGLKGLSDIFKRLRPTLLEFKDERGRILYDLPDAPRPNADTPAPVRFLPEFDTMLLSHADRTRIIADEHRKLVATPNLRVLATFLVDGFAAGLWTVERKKKTAALAIKPFAPLDQSVQNELIEEGSKLLRFMEEDAGEYEVRLPR